MVGKTLVAVVVETVTGLLHLPAVLADREADLDASAHELTPRHVDIAMGIDLHRVEVPLRIEGGTRRARPRNVEVAPGEAEVVRARDTDSASGGTVLAAVGDVDAARTRVDSDPARRAHALAHGDRSSRIARVGQFELGLVVADEVLASDQTLGHGRDVLDEGDPVQGPAARVARATWRASKPS
jgi:hypothetical protein